ncbi:hypothetical protein [Pseudomonas sp. GM55]|uniref:hypothetical protein n=1 Tax=Pseudomonas sp. GM55 TaxID=1144333 RepID=UPI000270AE6A|nr:hypothetical protein [Pseudomonas sp. GM55]EJM78916.1 hypothetical protein PMI31_00241 [Pseudomonas sp. GM55]
MVFTFTLHYQLTSHESDVDALVERLAEEGCDDALVGTGLPGRLALEFIREAFSAREVMEGAIADVSRALPTARLIEAAFSSV